MTIGCARCHDHKFDPVSTRDYYALAGILRSTKTLKNYTDNVAHWIDTPLPLDGEPEAEMNVKHEAAGDIAEARKIKSPRSKMISAMPAAPSCAARRPSPRRDLPGIVVDDTEAQKVGFWKPPRTIGPFIGESYVKR
jgi:hypothetical protein